MFCFAFAFDLDMEVLTPTPLVSPFSHGPINGGTLGLVGVSEAHYDIPNLRANWEC
jgi:hypothetical protein